MRLAKREGNSKTTNYTGFNGMRNRFLVFCLFRVIAYPITVVRLSARKIHENTRVCSHATDRESTCRYLPCFTVLFTLSSTTGVPGDSN